MCIQVERTIGLLRQKYNILHSILPIDHLMSTSLPERLAYAMQGHGIGKILRPAHKVYALSCPLLKDKPTKYIFISLVILTYCY